MGKFGNPFSATCLGQSRLTRIDQSFSASDTMMHTVQELRTRLHLESVQNQAKRSRDHSELNLSFVGARSTSGRPHAC